MGEEAKGSNLVLCNILHQKKRKPWGKNNFWGDRFQFEVTIEFPITFHLFTHASKAKVWMQFSSMPGANVKKEFGQNPPSTWTYEPAMLRVVGESEGGYFPTKWIWSSLSQLLKLWGPTKRRTKPCGTKKQGTTLSYPNKRTVWWFQHLLIWFLNIDLESSKPQLCAGVSAILVPLWRFGGNRSQWGDRSTLLCSWCRLFK